MADATQAQFAALLEAWAATIVANDPQAIDGFMAPEWVIVGQNGIMTRDQFLGWVSSGVLTHDMMRFDVHRVREYGDTVVVTARGVNSGVYAGDRFEADEWVSDVFILRDGAWRCVHSQLTPAS